MESNLFNGEYFYQKINLHDRSILEKFDGAADACWNFETGEIKYQIGEGCAIDTPLAQWYADLYGLGELYSSAMNRSTLSAIFRHNFKKSLRNELNVWRTYALNDESGTLVCTWPKGKKRPKIPLTYNSECMTGFEWAFAGHLVAAGLLKEGETVAKAIRDRFDGCRRNPWNEFECGSNYARSMASYGMLLAYSGFCYDSSIGMIGFFPKTVPFSTFWSLGDFWGIFCAGIDNFMNLLFSDMPISAHRFLEDTGALFDKYIDTVSEKENLRYIGGKMILEAVRPEDEDVAVEQMDAPLDLKELFVLAVATSIDALAVGITFAFLSYPIVEAISVIGVTTFIVCIIGVYVGNFFGNKYKNKAEFAGGLILVILGTRILLTHLGIIG